ncbi:myosin heavy chain, clone 203-like [Palaemon carinicauda]|uniref:myosin heavy chain, clone 203-like n=1 Tax=Palaemon carinicauda TaxID=392227 RepID=UPI0035B6895C
MSPGIRKSPERSFSGNNHFLKIMLIQAAGSVSLNMAFKVNEAISVFMDTIGNLEGRFGWPQKAGSALLQQNLACKDMTVHLQGQLRTLQESWVFKWFSWLLPEAPRFEDGRAVTSQDGFLGRWLQCCPWIESLWKAREELQRREHGLHQMETEALRFKDELKSTWFVGKLLSEFDFGERKEEALSNGNKNFYIGMAAASVILSGIMLARRRMAGEDVDNSSAEEYVPEIEPKCEDLLDGKELKMEDEDRTTLLETLEAENEKLRRQIEEMGRMVEIKENLQSDCNEKDLQMKELEKLMENIRSENYVVKKEQIEKNELVEELKKEVGKLKAKNTKLESECVKKDLQMKEQENLMESIRNENEVVKAEQFEKNELVKELKNQVDEFEQEREKLKADMAQDYEKLKFLCKIKDLEIMERNMIAESFENENEEMKNAQSKNMEQLNKLKSVVSELKAEKEKLEAECVEKDLQMKKPKNWLENLRNENEKVKTKQNEKTKNLNKLKRDVLGLKAEKAELKSEYFEKDLQVKKLKNFLKNLRNENEKVKINQNQEMEQLNKWKREVDQLKEEREKIKADMAQDNEKLEFACKIKDLEIME